MEILSDAVHARKGQDVAAYFFVGACGGHLGEIRPGLIGVPVSVKCSGRVRIGSHFDLDRGSSRAENVRFDVGVGCRQKLFVAHLG